jgi:EAL domain-containing protein (putative c-di-GMP-specific phosphodiesterase class I)
MYPDHGTDQQTLVRNGKLAALAGSGSAERIAIYDPAHGESEERTVRYQGRLRRALEENALALAFEPQLDPGSGRIAGLECVLRWSDAELGEVSEAQALETAENAGLTREVTWWIFNNALRLCSDFARGGLALPIGLKVATSALAQPDFTEFVDRALRTWGVAPGRVLIEIQEAALTGGIDQVNDTLTRLKGLGLRLGIGGFGTGSSSLSNLAQLPLDEMKLAGLFVTDMREVAFHAKIVRALVDLAQNLGLTVTAAGVVDAESALALSALGCRRIQGRYVGRPLAFQEVQACDMSGDLSSRLPLAAAATA